MSSAGPAPGGDEATPTALAIFRRSLFRRKEVFVSTVVATVVVNLIALATSLYSMQVYDRVIPRSGFATLWVLTVGILFALLLDFGLRTTRALMIEREAARIDAEVSEYFFARAQSIRLDARPPGVGTMAGQLRGWEQVRSLLSSGFIFLLTDLPFAIFFIVVISWLGGVIALVPLAFLPVALLFGLVFARLIRADTAKAQLSGNRKNGLLVESLDAAETVKANGGSRFMLERWIRQLGDIQLHEDPVKRWSSIATSLFSLLQQVAYVLLVAWGAVRVAQGELTMGALIACTILAGRINGPLVAQLPGFLVQWGYARSSLKSLDDMLALPLDQPAGAASLRPDRVEPSVRLDNVRFTYPGSRSGIEIPALHIGAGERVAIIGGVGSGKSTLLRLMSGMFAPATGEVTLGGLDIAQVAPDILRRDLGYVPQDMRMLNGTLRENLLLGIGDRSDAAIMAVIEELGLAPMIAGHPRGLDLPIAEGGRGLSGGQRTLAHLARAFLADPDLLLLDEPTANLDEAAEARVLDGLKKRAAAGKTLVLVTHRMRLLSLSERVIVLQNGRVALDGETDKVMAAFRDAAAARAPRAVPQQAQA
jgi:ATP-binding cassette subfamily C protein LapB